LRHFLGSIPKPLRLDNLTRWHPLLPKDDDAVVRQSVRSFLAYLGAEMTENSVSSRRGGYSK
jgi:hypothetical protein